MMPEKLLQWAAEEREKQAAFKHNIRVCMAAGCLSTDSGRVKAALQAEVEARGLNGACQVKGVGCLGLCSLGPLIKVDDHYCRHVSPEDASEIMGSGGMIVMADKACMVDVARYFMEFSMSESWGKCVPCRVGTAQMYGLLTRISKGLAAPGDLPLLEACWKTSAT
jgi:NADH:ubiquinone oxidoreductase subunit F (NADH-binding)